jgi:hypothetical protein
LIFDGQHRVISQKTELFITIAVRTSSPTSNYFRYKNSPVLSGWYVMKRKETVISSLMRCLCQVSINVQHKLFNQYKEINNEEKMLAVK